MPGFLAVLASSVVGWLVEAPLREAFGAGVSLLLGFAASVFAFFFVKRLLADLRAGG